MAVTQGQTGGITGTQTGDAALGATPAVARLAQELGIALDTEAETMIATRLHGVVCAIVEKHAPDAPADVQNEALLPLRRLSPRL